MNLYDQQRLAALQTDNPVMRELLERKSVRVYTEDPITPEEKAAILLAAAEAPTAGGQQMYTILDITDPAKKQALAESCDHQPFIANAPMVLVFCTDCLRWYRGYQAAGSVPRKPGMGDFSIAVTDTAIAAQNAVTAAWSMGIGSCYIGDIMEQYEIHRELLELPDYVVPTVMVVFGRPTKQQALRPKPTRIDMCHLVAENTYPKRQDEDYPAVFQNLCGEDFAGYMQGFCRRKYHSGFALEMTRSMERHLEPFWKEQK